MTFLAIALIAASASAKSPDLERKAQAKEVLAKLAKDGYFKSATCREIADTVLTRLGLPETAKSGPVAGKRTGFDRSKQTSEPPVLTDGLVAVDGTKLKITTKELGNLRWLVTIEREKSDAYLMSQFAFERPESQRSCDLTEIKLKKSRKGSLQTESALTCLDYFLIDEAVKIPGTAGLFHDWIKEDCLFALHYSREAREGARAQ